VYLSGFPTDGTVDESFLSELFVSFGRIRKVHLYRHKGTDILKGDGLVIYQSAADGGENAARCLVQNVCSQVSRKLRLR